MEGGREEIHDTPGKHMCWHVMNRTKICMYSPDTHIFSHALVVFLGESSLMFWIKVRDVSRLTKIHLTRTNNRCKKQAHSR